MNYNGIMLTDTICAISTALKEAAISIIRISGEDAFDVIKEISDIKEIKPNTIVYTHLYENKEVLDEVLVSFFKGPKSYTREDMVEINSHGGIYLTRKILNLLLSKGCRLAEPGEFTKRAYLNGRIDLSKAESINDLIKADNEIKAKSAIKGLSGSIERLLTPMMEEIKDVISMIEVNIDYPEYDDVEQMANDKVRPYLIKWINDSKEMIGKAERFRVVKDGLNTVIIGKPNVGKSSLLNALLEEEKAIVTNIAGTTRDLVEGKVNLKNISLNLIDTAGIRESDDVVEKIGIDRSLKALEKAELVLLVMDSSNIDEEDLKLLKISEKMNRIVIYNKCDLNKMSDGICVSCKNNDIHELIDYLNNEYKEDIKLVDEDILNNERQISLMKKALISFEDMLNKIDECELDVIEIDLEEAFHQLSEILGREYKEDLIDHMFKNFCLGK